MRFNEAKYTRRLNTGNYQHDEATISAAIDETDNIDECLALVKGKTIGWLTDQLPGKVAQVKATSVKAPAEKTAVVETTTAPEKEVEPTPASEKATTAPEKEVEKAAAPKRGRKPKATEEKATPPETNKEVETAVDVAATDGVKETTEVTIDAEEVKKILLRVYKEIKQETAFNIIGKFGTNSVKDLAPENYKEVYDTCLATLAKHESEKKGA